MAAVLVSILAILVVGFFVLRRGQDQIARQNRTARGLMAGGLIPLGLQVAIYLLFGIGEMASGDLSGAGHLLPAISSVLLGVLSWQQPQKGAALFLVGVVTAAGLQNTTATLIMAAPQILSGLLFLIGGMIAHNQATPGTNQGS
jgi:hypothetical protein